tara:strand:+ start:492 stop:830 length:339 start_codon:yes stop_codon:yes gene_type:complete
MRELLLLCFFLPTFSCNHNELSVCETESPSFTDCVEPIINLNCTGCHVYGSAANTSTILTNYDAIKLAVDQNDLLNRIKYNSSNENMPPAGKMSNQDITIIENWIDDGLQNN